MTGGTTPRSGVGKGMRYSRSFFSGPVTEAGGAVPSAVPGVSRT